MREIKFRLIYQSPDTDEPNKVLVSKPIRFIDLVHVYNHQIDFTDGGYLMLDEVDSRYAKWVQWTGLKDKRGVEIYEDDIAKQRPINMDIDNIGVVSISPTQGVCIGPYCFFVTPIEVIGNIHSNPELLEVKTGKSCGPQCAFTKIGRCYCNPSNPELLK